MRSYKKSEVLSDLADALNSPATLYKQPFINYRGMTTDTGEKYTEMLAAALLENIGALESIPSAPRTKGYKVASHDGMTKADNSNREEERIALSMFHKEYDGIGRILDYQVPLKNTSTDKGLGKIVLLSYDGRCLRLLELKSRGARKLCSVACWKSIHTGVLLMIALFWRLCAWVFVLR